MALCGRLGLERYVDTPVLDLNGIWEELVAAEIVGAADKDQLKDDANPNPNVPDPNRLAHRT